MVQVTPISIQKTESPAQISSLELMKVIMKINHKIETSSFASYNSKKEQLSIFQKESKNHQKLKIKEAVALLSLALATGACQLYGKTLDDGMKKTIFKIAGKVMPMVNQSATSIFNSYETLYGNKKYIAQTESDAAKDAQARLDQQLQQNLEKATSYTHLINSLTQSR